LIPWLPMSVASFRAQNGGGGSGTNDRFQASVDKVYDEGRDSPFGTSFS